MERQSVRGPWTSSEIAILVREAARGQGYVRRVAAATGRTTCAVERKAAAMRRRGHPDAPAPSTHDGPPRSRWDGHALVRLRGMADAGLTQAEAAAALGRTPTAVALAAAKYGVTFPRGKQRNWRWTRAMTNTLIDGIEDGRTYEAIARSLGVTEVAVSVKASRLRRRGLAPVNTSLRVWTPREELLLRGMVERRVATSAIAERLGRTVTAVYVRKKKLGLRSRTPKEPPPQA